MAAQEVDITSPAFSTLWTASEEFCSDRNRRYTRGLRTNHCYWAQFYPALLDAGRASVESAVNFTTSSHIGSLALDGRSGGALPFTSISPHISALNAENTFDIRNATPGRQFPSSARYNLTQHLQGSSARVECSRQGTSPINITQVDAPECIGDHVRVTSSLKCNGASYYTEQCGTGRRVRAGLCSRDGGRECAFHLSLPDQASTFLVISETEPD